ncbi:MAG TPA: hypothetical protein PLS55_08535, partial [Thermogutta sp.]|nr:hypothetical protein [Thermogutta sp.]
MSHDHPTPPEVNRKLVIALVVVFLGYGLSLGLGWPQAATRMIVEAESHASASAHHDSGADQHKAPAHSEESASETTSP